jgi:O-antigen ligase
VREDKKGIHIMATAEPALRKLNRPGAREATRGAFFWLSAFYVVYCARPEDWIPPLRYVPLAKISAIFAIIGLLSSMGRTKRGLKSLPSESKYLLAMILLLLVWAPFSPVWRGGAVSHTLDFGKVYFAWVLTFLLVTTLARLRRLIFVQAGSVALISIVSVLKGSSHPRLEGVLGGIYSNPNDLAFAIVLTLPLILLLLLTTRNVIWRVAWGGAMLAMMYTLFLTASRAGFIDLLISAPVALWFFGVRGRRPQLIVGTIVVGVLLMAVAGKHLRERFFAISGSNLQTGLESSAYGSYEDRKFLIERSLTGIAHYPLTGLGAGDFPSYSGIWHQVHMTYLEIGVEGGIPVLILYLMFFYSGFRNLKKLRKRRDLDPEATLFMGALYSCLVGFMVGACFAPEAYQFFPYFTIAYISALLATVQEKDAENAPLPPSNRSERLREVNGNYGREGAVTVVR